jgi:hypothetical protein
MGCFERDTRAVPDTVAKRNVNGTGRSNPITSIVTPVAPIEYAARKATPIAAIDPFLAEDFLTLTNS